MANRAKDKGDRYERSAVAMLVETCPELLRENPQRLLGAGRKEDVGDLYAFPDVAVQVRALSNAGAAIRSSALDAVAQARNGRMEHALGLVPVIGARPGRVRWLAAVVPGRWPGDPDGPEAVDFGTVSKALTWLSDDQGPYGYRVYPREERVAKLVAASAQPVLVAPFEAWLASYRVLRARPLRAVLD